ncbi:helix-turn-helix domain-containing protein [Rhodospira trueperi]|uniref:DNA-binding transcriptional regulator YiaG, contains XRE-type HTH domain n=1 Tax=Rhodospira trueperi TaxID=69960 RepID=A0A1G6YH00_9PROT|nr:helix-turn-helix domain-containing protein [Rhodospira trueperi]SDD89561.1 DNA-binding transcriptional regulator YiaG, contains XRE-type HTH domain [Rhodospira trueperi]
MAGSTTQDDLYHFTECGLDDVWVEGVEETVDEDGDTVLVVPRVQALHRLIVRALIGRDGPLIGAEVKAIRTEMGLTQAELGDLLRKEALTVGRWERGETPIDPNADAVLRLVSNERLALGRAESAETTARRCAAPRDGTPIIIRRNDLDRFFLPSAA